MSKNDEQHTLVPRLRFPEFREDGSWQPHFFADLVQRVRTSVSTKEITIEDYVSTENLLPEFGGVTLASNLPPTNTVTQFRPGDTLLANIRPYLKKAWFATDTGGASNDVFVFRSRGQIDPRFLSYRIQSDAFIAYVMSAAKGVKMPRGELSHIEQFPLPLPEQELEQQKVADCLGSLDDLIAAEGRKLAALRDHKKGLIQQLFPREGETRPRLRFPEFRDAGEWGVIPLAKLLDRDPQYGVNAAAVPFAENLPAYIRITDIDDDGRYLLEGRVSVDIEATDDDYLHDGDIVLARTGASVGKSYRYRTEDGRLVFAGFLIRIRPKPTKLDSRFLAAYLSTSQYWDWVRITSARSGQPGINASEYASMPLPIPPDDDAKGEQLKIADCLSALDALITAQAEKLDALRTYKRGLMQQLFPSAEDAGA